MNKTQDIQDTTACLRQFQSAPAGCSARDISLAQGIPVDRCNDLLARLHQAALIEETCEEGRFLLIKTATALDVMKAVWMPVSLQIQVLFETTNDTAALLRPWSRVEWAQG